LSIEYLPYLFPEDNFTDTALTGLKIKSLVPQGNAEIEVGVFNALKTIFSEHLFFLSEKQNDSSSLLER
jgi:hypothetical protein